MMIPFYRSLLRLFPGTFRERYQDEMLRTFAERRRDAAIGGRWQRLCFDDGRVQGSPGQRGRGSGLPSQAVARGVGPGPPVRRAHAVAAARALVLQRCHAWAGHRRHHRDRRPDPGGADRAASVPPAGRHRDHPRRAGRTSRGDLVREPSRPAGTGGDAVGPFPFLRAERESDRRGRTGSPAWWFRHQRILRRRRRTAGDRCPVRPGRRHPKWGARRPS